MVIIYNQAATSKEDEACSWLYVKTSLSSLKAWCLISAKVLTTAEPSGIPLYHTWRCDTKWHLRPCTCHQLTCFSKAAHLCTVSSKHSSNLQLPRALQLQAGCPDPAPAAQWWHLGMPSGTHVDPPVQAQGKLPKKDTGCLQSCGSGPPLKMPSVCRHGDQVATGWVSPTKEHR